MAIVKPEFIQEAETTWNTATTPKATASFEVKKGDVLVAYCTSEEASGRTYGISGGSLTWTSQQVVAVNAYTYVRVWTATVDADKSMTVSFARESGESALFGGNVLTFRKSGGIGKSAKANVSGAAPSLSITTEKEHSAIVVVNGDWNAADGEGTKREWRTGAGSFTEQTYFRDGSHYTVYGGFHPDASAAAAKTVGLTKPTGQKYAIIAIEVLGLEEAGEEKHSGTTSVSATGTVSATGSAARRGSSAVSGSGSASAQGSASRRGASQVSATGSVSATGAKSAGAASSVSASGAASVAGSKQGLGSSSVSAAGAASAQGLKAASTSSSIDAVASASAGGSKQAFGTSAVTATGTVSTAGTGAEPKRIEIDGPTTAVIGAWVTLAKVQMGETVAELTASPSTARIAPVVTAGAVSGNATKAEIASTPPTTADLQPYKTKAKARA